MKWMNNRQWTIGMVVWLGTASAWAVYNPFPLRDATRAWSVSLYSRGGYDDNINTSSKNRDGSTTFYISPQVLLNLALEETFAGLRYSYGATYYTERSTRSSSGAWDQSHSADFLFSHQFGPRLVLDINDRLRRGVEPELVEYQAGQPVTVRRVGDYYYNNLNGVLTYNLSRRWTVSTSGSWQLWRYDNSVLASNSDYNVYQSVNTLQYSLDPQTYVGANYRFSATRYSEPGLNNGRDSDSHAVYASLMHRFNPKLTGSVNAGYEHREYRDDATAESPYGTLSLSYSYAPGSALTMGLSYSFSDSAPGYSSYRTAESLVGSLQVSHLVTPKLRLSVDTAYGFSTYKDPLTGSPSATVSPQTVSVGAVARYSFTSWVSAELSYYYNLQYGDSEVTDFYRNRIYLGVRFVY